MQTCALAPAILGAADKSGNKAPVIGVGKHTYEAIHDWGELPAGIKYGNTHGVVEDSQGHIYVHHTVHADERKRRLHGGVRREGQVRQELGQGVQGRRARAAHPQRRQHRIPLPLRYGARHRDEGDAQRRIGFHDRLPGQSAEYKPGADGKKPKYSPTNLAIAPNGDLYVGDGYGSSYINQYNSKGEYIRTFGGKGKEAGKLDCPHGIIVDRRDGTPILTVADRGNARIQRFTLDGKHIDFVSGTNMPCHFNFFKNGDVVVPDLGARVTLLDKQNKVIANLGDDSESKWRDTRKLSRDHFTPGKFVAPHGACFDHEGNIFVVEWVEVGRVTKLRRV